MFIYICLCHFYKIVDFLRFDLSHVSSQEGVELEIVQIRVASHVAPNATETEAPIAADLADISLDVVVTAADVDGELRLGLGLELALGTARGDLERIGRCLPLTESTLRGIAMRESLYLSLRLAGLLAPLYVFAVILLVGLEGGLGREGHPTRTHERLLDLRGGPGLNGDNSLEWSQSPTFGRVAGGEVSRRARFERSSGGDGPRGLFWATEVVGVSIEAIGMVTGVFPME